MKIARQELGVKVLPGQLEGKDQSRCRGRLELEVSVPPSAEGLLRFFLLLQHPTQHSAQPLLLAVLFLAVSTQQ
jgi:hypothetical protein